MSTVLSVDVERIEDGEVISTSVFQSDFWAKVKSSQWASFSFAYSFSSGKRGSFLCLVRRFFHLFSLAYVPFGPGILDRDELILLSENVRRYLPKSVFLIRYDLPWGVERIDCSGRLRRAFESVQPEGTVRIDLSISPEYRSRAVRNLRREEDVTVSLWKGDEESLQLWYETYLETGRRDGFSTRSLGYIRSLLSLKGCSVEPRLYIAYYGKKVCGGILNLRNGSEEVYLFGSSIRHGNISCGYRLQDYAINDARSAGVGEYDLFGIPGREGGEHLSSLKLFKTSFGGECVYRERSIDYLYNAPLSYLYRLLEGARYLLCRRH